MVAILQLKASKHFVYFVSIAVVTFTLLKSIDKLKTKPKNDFTATYNYDDDNISVLDKTEYDYYDINSKREQNYRFDNDDEILNSFSKIFK